jgi:N6-adenosine-specific RNA methylase IME4
MILARVLVIDPPWNFTDKLPGEKRSAESHYKVMTLCDIARMPLPPIADDAVLFLWRVSSMVPAAYGIVRTLGFKAKSEIVWNKTDSAGELSLGMGRIVRGSHETCIVATRGRGIEPKSKSEKTSFLAPRGKHSEKPDAFFHLVERLYPLELWPEGHVELFARRRRKGWICFGDELPPEHVEDGHQPDECPTGECSTEPAAATPPQSIDMSAAEVAPTDHKPGPAPHRVTETSSRLDGQGGRVCANDLLEPPAPSRASWSLTGEALAREAAHEAAMTLAGLAPPAENLSRLAQQLQVRGFEISLVTLAGMSPLQRAVARSYVEQGGDPPLFLDEHLRGAQHLRRTE